MSDNPLEVAYNPAAPANERDDAMRVAQAQAKPSQVDSKMLELVMRVSEQLEEDRLNKALEKNKGTP